MASTPVPMNAGAAQATNPYMSYDQMMRNRAGALNAGAAGMSPARPMSPAPTGVAQQASATPGMDYDAMMRNRGAALNVGAQPRPQATQQMDQLMTQTGLVSMPQQSAAPSPTALTDEQRAYMRQQVGQMDAANAARQSQAGQIAQTAQNAQQQAQAYQKSAMESTQRTAQSPQTNRRQFMGTSRGSTGVGNRFGYAGMSRGRAGKATTNPADQQAAYQRAMSRVSS